MPDCLRSTCSTALNMLQFNPQNQLFGPYSISIFPDQQTTARRSADHEALLQRFTCQDCPSPPMWDVQICGRLSVWCQLLFPLSATLSLPSWERGAKKPRVARFEMTLGSILLTAAVAIARTSRFLIVLLDSGRILHAREKPAIHPRVVSGVNTVIVVMLVVLQTQSPNVVGYKSTLGGLPIEAVVATVITLVVFALLLLYERW